MQDALQMIQDKQIGCKGIGGENVDINMDDEAVQGANNGEAKRTDPMKDLIIDKKHPLIEYIAENSTKFVMLRAPSEDYLIHGLKTS